MIEQKALSDPSKRQFIKEYSVGIAILTFNSEKHLGQCLGALATSTIQPKILVVDSSSKDQTITIAKNFGAQIVAISQNEFNHGATREKARKLLNTDIIVMMTPDAYACDDQLLTKLIKPLIAGQASISYARQIPHVDAGFFGAFSRDFNYPATSQLRSIKDVEKYGVYTFFCSDSCAAYMNKALDEIGGFPFVLFGEDTLVTAKLLKNGHKIAYVAEAVVRHSHDYSLSQEFRRHFDMGLVRKQFQHLIDTPEKDTQRGGHFIKEMFARLLKDKPHLLPYACCHLLAKWTGYQLGRISLQAPPWFKKIFSSQPGYWDKKL